MTFLLGTGGLWLVTFLYSAQGAYWAASGKPQMALILAGYTIANIGLIWSAKP